MILLGGGGGVGASRLIGGAGGGAGGQGPLFCKLLLFLQVFVGIFEEFEEVRCFCSGESSYSGIIFVLVVLAC